MSVTPAFNRDQFAARLTEETSWDLLIIGGGATGLGIAVDSASRGYKTLLLEQADFAKGTSSRSTKLIHGGVRYLEQGNLKLVLEALKERGILWRNAPHLVKKQSFIIPCYSFFSKCKYLLGLKLYDALSGRYSFGRSRFVTWEETAERFPSLTRKKLVGGVEYFDGQFDDARLAIHLARTAAAQGAMLLNYFQVTGLLKEKGRVTGVLATDLESKKEFGLKAKAVINATGVFVDTVLQMDATEKGAVVQASQGIHLVVDGRFLGSSNALMIPKTVDGRVIFALPWHDRLLLGTTDTPLQLISLEPQAIEEEVAFILATIKEYLSPAPERSDVLSVFAGLRPLAVTGANARDTKEISRDHKLMISPSGLITITGGKWTTYRKMAEEVVDEAIKIAGLSPKTCRTKTLAIQGANETLPAFRNAISTIASHPVLALINDVPSLGKRLVDDFPYTEAEVVWVVREEMARTVEDVLARRLRVLFLDAAAAIQAAPRVAQLMAAELGCDSVWEKNQVTQFTTLANQYFVTALKMPVKECRKSLT